MRSPQKAMLSKPGPGYRQQYCSSGEPLYRAPGLDRFRYLRSMRRLQRSHLRCFNHCSAHKFDGLNVMPLLAVNYILGRCDSCMNLGFHRSVIMNRPYRA